MENDIGNEIKKLVIENLRKTVPAATKEAVKSSQLKDTSTRVLGYSKLTKKGITP